MCLNDHKIIGPHNHPLSLDSGNSVKQFIKAAAIDFGRPAIAITDHGTMGAIIEAHEYAKELKKKENVNIQIIPGVELYLKPDEEDAKSGYYHVTVHFDDFDSYLEGCKISKSSFDRAEWKGAELKPIATWADLESLSGKVTLFSSCLVGAVLRPWNKNRKDISEKNFVRLMNIAGKDRFYAEIFPYEVSKNWNGKTKTFDPIPPSECSASGKLQVDGNLWIMHLAEKYGVPLVVSEDAHYAHPEDKFIQDARLNKDGRGTWKMSDANCLHTTEWIFNELNRIHPEINEHNFRQMIDNSHKFLQNFKGFEPKFKPALPKVYINRIKDGETHKEELKTDSEFTTHVLSLIQQKKRIDLSNSVYAQRLNKELQQLGYNGKVNILPYFLTLNTIVDHCSKEDILDSEIMIGPGRGSAAGSLLSYTLGITSVDPIKEDLSFERFFDVTRVEEGLADIDTDFSDREKAVEFIKRTWGDHFAYLGIGTTFKTKSALKDIDRYIHGEVRKETEEVCRSLPKATPQGLDEELFLKGYRDTDGMWQEGELDRNEKLKSYLENNPKVAEYLFKMVGILRQMGRHAAGVLIADRPVHHFIPIMKVSDEPTTQLLPKWVEKCGGIKYDILGLNTLKDILMCLKLIKKRTGKTIDPWKIEDEYEYWEAAINEPSTIFQLHTDTVRSGLQTMRPHSVQEAAILTSVFRPGAMDAQSDEDPTKNMSQIFLERWTGKRPVHYTHPELEPILGPTKGIIVYQEQIMKIVHELGGLSMPETNKLRKAISKKESDDLKKMLGQVKENLMARGWSEFQAVTVANQMKASGRYCFNKSHAVSYCYIARACAYLKYYYPIEWWTSVLSNSSKDDLQYYWQFVTNSNSLEIKLPDINTSTNDFQIVPGAEKEVILAPLSMVEGVGPAVMSAVVAARPFTSLEHMMTSVDRRVVNKGPMIKLILSGSLNNFFDKEMMDYQKIQEYLNLKAKLEGKKNPESVPMEYIETTPLKEFLIKKSVFKVWTDDLRVMAIPKLVSSGQARMVKDAKVLEFLVKNKQGDIVERRPIVSLKTFERLEEDQVVHRVAVVGYVVDTEDKLFQNNTKTRLVINLEVEDRTMSLIKWPAWGKTHHGISEDLSDSVCVVLLSKWKRDGEFFVDDVCVLENLNFLKEKEEVKDEPKSKRTKKKV